MEPKRRKIDYTDYILEIVLALLIILTIFMAPGFFTTRNLLNVLRNSSMQGVIVFGMTMTIICGQIDLSVGSSVALYGVVAAKVAGSLAAAGVISLDYAIVVGMAVALVLSAMVGWGVGEIHVWLKIPTIIITLALMNILYGLAAIISNGFPVTTVPPWYSTFGAGRLFWNIPNPALILLATFAVVFFVMTYTRLGREVYAVGGNEESARLCGINVRKVKIACMIAPQVAAALSGIMVSSQVMSASSTFGKGFEMTAISAVIIGGASLNGGIGKVWGSFIGVIFLGIISNGMTILNINEFIQYVIRGLLILVAVAFNTIMVNRRQSAG